MQIFAKTVTFSGMPSLSSTNKVSSAYFMLYDIYHSYIPLKGVFYFYFQVFNNVTYDFTNILGMSGSQGPGTGRLNVTWMNSHHCGNQFFLLHPPTLLLFLFTLMVSHLYRWRAHLVNFSAEAPHSWSNFHINDIKPLPSIINWACGRNLLGGIFLSFSSFHSFCLACVGRRLNQNYLKISYTTPTDATLS